MRTDASFLSSVLFPLGVIIFSRVVMFLPSRRMILTACVGGSSMPHAGLMNEAAMGPLEGPLQRARLHLRGGKRRLRQGKIAAGIVTLYDALSAAMEWYVSSPEGKKGLTIFSGEDLNDDGTAYRVLVSSGVLDGKFDFNGFDRLVEQAFDHEMTGFDPGEVLAGIESVMTQLGVMPFDEASLPLEDPGTF
jgi:hypothetical protein